MMYKIFRVIGWILVVFGVLVCSFGAIFIFNPPHEDYHGYLFAFGTLGILFIGLPSIAIGTLLAWWTAKVINAKLASHPGNR